MFAIRLDEVARVDDPPEPGVADAAEVVGSPDQLLQFILDGIVELEAVAVEDLEAVVVGRVVRGRDHDPADERAAAGQEGEGRGGHDADLMDVDAEAGRPGRDGRHEHVAGATGVLADDERSPTLPEVAGGGSTEVEREGRLEIDVGDATDPVRPEQSWH